MRNWEAVMRGMRHNARARSRDGKTGLATYHSVQCAYYPRCRRYAWFTPKGKSTYAEALDRLVQLDRQIRRNAKEEALS